jgi:hypothetical protein
MSNLLLGRGEYLVRRNGGDLVVLFVVMGGVFEGGTERKNLLLLKKQTPSNAVECVLGVGDLLR